MSAAALTQSQRAAVEANRHVAVVAGAGSGKTRVLIERYLTLLARDPSQRPGELLAITFTNRAASEMKRRLRDRLRQLAEGEGAIAEQARASLDEFHHAAVMTIHAFASETLRAHPFDAGLDPSFAVADEITARSARE